METAPPLGSIVVGVDGTDASRQALQWAADQASLEGRPLCLVHVDDPRGRSGAGEGTRAILAEAVAVVEWRQPAVEVHTSSGAGDAREILVEIGDRASLLIVGSRGRGPIGSTLLGSVSVAVGTRAACPVVVVRPHHRGAVRRGVLVGVDTTPASRAPLEFGYRMASIHDLPLTVLHCVADADMDEHRRDLAELVAGMGEKFPDVHVKRQLARKRVADGILEHQGVDQDLVVVGRHHHPHRPGHGITTLAGTVIERGACAVAVVPTVD